MSGLHPTHTVSTFNKKLKAGSGTIGVVWMKPDGSGSLKLDPGISLKSHPDVVIKLWPYRDTDRVEMTGFRREATTTDADLGIKRGG